MTSWSIDGQSDSSTPDPDSAATNRARAIAAIDKIAAAQDAISDDIAEMDTILDLLNGSPSNAEILGAIIDIAGLLRAVLVRQKKLGDYLTDIIKWIKKSISNGA